MDKEENYPTDSRAFVGCILFGLTLAHNSAYTPLPSAHTPHAPLSSRTRSLRLRFATPEPRHWNTYTLIYAFGHRSVQHTARAIYAPHTASRLHHLRVSSSFHLYSFISSAGSSTNGQTVLLSATLHFTWTVPRSWDAFRAHNAPYLLYSHVRSHRHFTTCTFSRVHHSRTIPLNLSWVRRMRAMPATNEPAKRLPPPLW